MSVFHFDPESESSDRDYRAPPGLRSADPGHLYFDFQKSAEDSKEASGRESPGLRTQLEQIRQRHPDLFAGHEKLAGGLLGWFLKEFFSEGLRQDYLVCNLSLNSHRQDQPWLSFRLKEIGPHLQSLLPRGLTLAVSGHLNDNRNDPNNSVLVVRKIFEMTHSERRSFELHVSGVVHTAEESVYPARVRRQNLLNQALTKDLPSISIETEGRLKDWSDFLDWKEKLIKARQFGIRYLRGAVNADGRYEFLVVAKDRQTFERILPSLRSEELRAFSPSVSKDQWVFQYLDTDRRGRDKEVELGDFMEWRKVEKAPLVPELEGAPWPQPFVAKVFFRLTDEAQNEYEAFRQDGRDVGKLSEVFGERLPREGFLALSVVGDMALVGRQRRELLALQEQSGYAPFLSSYLFDIQEARKPSVLEDIPETDWSRPDLNRDQREAVRKMISTVDLSMVQGPPGTGKTTMIAEAVYQLIRRGKKVLLASQANLAVDNILERLPQKPLVRALRLGRKGEAAQPYSQEQALETYYRSIAGACRAKHLDGWQEAERQMEAASRRLAEAELAKADWQEAMSSENALREQTAERESQLGELRQQEAQASRVKRARQEVDGFLKFLAGESVSWDGDLPEELWRTFFQKVVIPLGGLRSEGIRLNPYWEDFAQASPGERPGHACAILGRWQTFLRDLPTLRGDLLLLQQSDAPTLLSPDQESRLQELHRQKAQLDEALTRDAGQLGEWQRVVRAISELQRQGNGLPRERYERIFNGERDGRPAWVLFTDAASSRPRLIQTLQVAETLCPQIQVGLEHFQRAAEEWRAAQVEPAYDPAATKQLEATTRELTERWRETTARRRDLENKLATIVGTPTGTVDREPVDLAQRYQEFHRQSTKVVQELGKWLEETRAARALWEPVLQEWVTNLESKKAWETDRPYFLKTYQAACNVVGVTCTENRRTLEEAGQVRFDMTIVDEVSKATPPEMLMPMMLSSATVLVGDHRQLPPLFKEKNGSFEEASLAREEAGETSEDGSSSELTPENLDRFQRMVTCSLFREHFQNAPDEMKASLVTQYRMHPQIMRVVNQFYEGQLECGLSAGEESRPHGLTLRGAAKQDYMVPSRHVLWVDSSQDPHGEDHFERLAGTSKENELEALLIARCLADLEMACRAQGYGSGQKPPKPVGVITFYGRQVQMIRTAVKRMLKSHGLSFRAILPDINTVDRYQGQERPIVLVSMVRRPHGKLSQRANTAQYERINVAYSRAQELLVILGAKDVFCEYPVNLPEMQGTKRRKVEVYRHILEEIQRVGGLWSANQILTAADFDAWKTPTPTSSTERQPIA